MILDRDTYTDRSISFLTSDVIEYDMQSAGFSIIKERKLISDEQIKELESIKDKKARQIKIGLLQRGNKPLRDAMSQGFKDFRNWFGVANGLTDDDILSIKKDAIFVKKFCYNTEYGEHIQFKEKNVYTSFLQFNQFEFYMNDNVVDVKGLTDDKVALHTDGVLTIIRNVMRLLSQYDDDGAIKYMVKTMNQYKTYSLPVNMYREFNSMSGYRIVQYGDMESLVDNVSDSLKHLLIINYNYMNVLVPLLNIVMG